MTRVRVLQRAIKLLEAGHFPYDYRSLARDKDGNQIAYMNPNAVAFNAAGAVMRAIYELTGDPADQRDKLWTESMRGILNKYGSWIEVYIAFETLTKEETIKLFQEQLENW